MSSEWRTLSLGELGRIVTGKTPPTARPDFFGGHIPFLTPTDMVDGQKAVQATRTLTDSGLATVKNCLVPRGVAVSCIGWQMGKSVLVLEPTVTNQQINTLIVDESRFNLSFVYYLLANMRDRIFELGATPTRTPIVNKSTFSRIAVQIPSLDEQKKIAAFGAMLDDRITLLRETNATLEAIAQALFKSWFVDFDPVRAKQEGRAPEGMDEATAALFPDGFEESVLGLVPRGWSVGSLATLMDIAGGTQPPASEFIESPREGFIRLIQIRDYETDAHLTFVPRTSKLRTTSAEDIMIARYGASVGRICWGLDGAYNVALVRIVCEPDVREFLRTYLSSQIFQSRLAAISGRSAQAGFNKGDIASFKLVLPASCVLSKYQEIVWPLRMKILHNRQQAKTLATLRDTLLPRLISGQLRLPDVEVVCENIL